MPTPVEKSAARSLWLSSGLPLDALSHLFLSENPNSAVDSSFKLGAVAQTSIGLSGLSAARFHALRTGVKQDVTVDARHAVLESHSETWYTVDGQLPDSGGAMWDSIAGLYRTKDNSFVRVHTNFPHHRAGILSILNIPSSPAPMRKTVSKALLEWNAVEFETEAAARGMCATALRSFDEWDQHPQAKALAGTPPVTLVKIGDAPKRETKGNYLRPLDGVRVLDLSRVLAGPVCGRTLAAHGADVLLITSPSLPSLPRLDVDTSRGKRTTQLDLTLSSDRQLLTTLAKETDVFLQAYRPGAIEGKGFGVEELAKARPGIVCANLRAWGWDGPWKDRRGFDSLVQTATGFNVAEAEAYSTFKGLAPDSRSSLQPRPFPLQALDHAAGYLLAFGISAALCKTITEGGSWEVRVSLAAVGQWVRSFGRLNPDEAFGNGRPLPPRTIPQDPEIGALAVAWPQSNVGTREGREDEDGKVTTANEIRTGTRRMVTAIRHSAILSATPVRDGASGGEAPIVLNAHPASWVPR